jgi:cytochrome P450
LAKHQKYQSRLRDELRQNLRDDALKDPPRQIASILESLPWLNAICNETIRLFPAVPETRRIAVRDTTIGGQIIPAGTDFVVPIWWLNRTTELWGLNATEFCPERWIDAETGKPNNNGGAESNYALLTFIHGPRSCIGQGFAKAELRALLAVWMLSFEFEMARPGEALVPEGMVTLKPKDGLYLRVKPT